MSTARSEPATETKTTATTKRATGRKRTAETQESGTKRGSGTKHAGRSANPESRSARTDETVANTVAFRTNDEDKHIIAALKRDDESASDLLRRALRQLKREALREEMYADMARLKDEDLSDEPADWGYDEQGRIVDLRGSDAHKAFDPMKKTGR